MNQPDNMLFLFQIQCSLIVKHQDIAIDFQPMKQIP